MDVGGWDDLGVGDFGVVYECGWDGMDWIADDDLGVVILWRSGVWIICVYCMMMIMIELQEAGLVYCTCCLYTLSGRWNIFLICCPAHLISYPLIYVSAHLCSL